MGRNRYLADVHDSGIICETDGCRVKNAPEDSEEYEPECWRCGALLPSEDVTEGDVLTVTTVDQHEDGTIVSKAETGLVVFVPESVETAEFSVKLTAVDRNCAYGTPVARDIQEETDEDQESGTKPPQRLGSRDNFWDSSQ